MPIIGRGASTTAGQQPAGIQAQQDFKPQKNWWRKAIDVLTTGEQFSSGVIQAGLRGERGPVAAFKGGVKGVREDITGADITREVFRKTTGREPEGLSEKAAITIGSVVLGGAIDPLTYVGLGPLGKMIGMTSKFALKTRVGGAAAGGAKALAGSKGGYKLMTWFNQGYDIEKNTRNALFRAGVEQSLAKKQARLLGKKIGKVTKKLTPEDNRTITSFLIGQIDELPENLKGLQPSFQAVRKTVDDIGQLAVKEGLISPQVYREGMGKWLPRLYQIYEPGNRQGALLSFFGRTAGDDLLGSHGILKTLNRNVLDEFRGNVNAKISQTGGSPLLGNESILDELNIYQAKDFAHLQRMFRTSNNEAVSAWYRSNRKVVDEAIDSYKKIEKDTGLGMFEYREIAKPTTGVPAAGSRQTLAGPSFKRRKEISEDFQQAMGLIEDPAVLVEQAIERVGVKIPTANLYKAIQANEKVLDFRQFKKFEAAGDIKASQFTRVPADKKRYGTLANKFIKKSVWENVVGANDLSKAVASGPVKNMYRSFLQAWKAGVTIFNPATQSRQFMSNIVFLDMKIGRGPVPGSNIAKPMVKAATQFVDMAKGKAGREVVEAEKAGLFVGMFGSEDFGAIRALEKAGQSAPTRAVGKASKVAGNVWNNVDNYFRMAAYNYYRDVKKFTPAKAVAQAHKAYFNYSDVPQVVKAARDYIPFITFGYKSTGLFAETIYKNPSRIMQWYRMENAVSKLDPKNASVDPGDVRDFMQDQVPLYVDENGRQKRLNMEYIYPWGSLTSSNPLGVISMSPFFKEPLFQALNYDPFFKQPIARSSVPSQAVAERAQHAARSFAPGIARPFIPGTAAVPGGKISEAVQGRPDVSGREFGVGEAVLSDIFGVKTSTIDLRREKKITSAQKKRAISKIQSEIRNVRTSKRLKPEEKTKQINKLREQLKKLRARR